MALDEGRQRFLMELSQAVLGALESLSRAARSKLDESCPGGPTDVLAVDTNPMVGGSKGRAVVRASYDSDRRSLAQVAREPFLARVEVDETDGEPTDRKVWYITRGSAASLGDAIPGAKVASYLSRVGRLAELHPGDTQQAVKVNARMTVTPEWHEGLWDAEAGSLEFRDWSVSIPSLRRLVQSTAIETEPEVADVLGELLAREEQGDLVRRHRRRVVIDRMTLRDQPILDRYQGDVFRMPLNRRVVMLGPPGAGKTTTLIRRLAQKRTPEALTDDERILLDRHALTSLTTDPHSWVMFSPTELLKLYLREAFNRESVPATASNLMTWDKKRLSLGRDFLAILRTAQGGRFQLKEELQVLRDSSSAAISLLHDDFTKFVEDTVKAQYEAALAELQHCSDEGVRKGARAQYRESSDGGHFGARQVAALLDDVPILQAEARRLENETRDRIQLLGNKLVRRHVDLLTELAEAATKFLEQTDEPEADEGDEEVAVETTESERSTDVEVFAARLLLDALRAKARALALDRTVGGRSEKVLDLLGDRLPPEQVLRSVGEGLVTLSHLRTVLNSPRKLVMDAPRLYDRFRRQAQKQGRHFTADSRDAIGERLISPNEVDVVILTMLRNARQLLQENRPQLASRSRHEWLEKIKQCYLLQVVRRQTDLDQCG